MILRHKPAIVMLAFVGWTLCVCASAQAGPPQEPTPDYRAIIGGSLRAKTTHGETIPSPLTYFENRGGIFGAQAKLDHVEIADTIRMVQTNYFGWAWQTCIRLNVNGTPVTYAVFIAGRRVVDARAGVAIDKCERAHYTPLLGAALR